MSYSQHIERLKQLDRTEVSSRVRSLVSTCPEGSWPVGMPSSIDPRLVLVGVSPGNSPMTDSSTGSDTRHFQSIPTVENDQTSHFYYPDTTGYWERLRYLCAEFFRSENEKLSEKDAISLSTHLNLGTGSAGLASVQDVEKAYVQWVSLLLNTEFNPDLVVLFGLKNILTDETVCGWWNHQNGLKVVWSRPISTVPFSRYKVRTYRFRIWEASNASGHRFPLVIWPNHPSRVPFRDIELWKASVSEALEALKSRA